MRQATEELVKWAEKLPGWQQDALRRLALSSPLTATDLEELHSILWSEHKLVDHAAAPAISPLTARHLREFDQEGIALKLLELNSVNNAMQLKPSEKLTFGLTGLTLIYGDNAAGKSGYARIIKRAARARGAERVRANVFDPNFSTLPPASAVFKVRITENGMSTDHELKWQENDGDSGLDELAGVRVFDRRGAAIYVNDKHQVAFAPANLDILTGLVEACAELEKGLDEARAETAQRIAVLINGIPVVGSTRPFASAVTALTTNAELDAASAWDPVVDAPRLSEIAKMLTETQRELALMQARSRRCSTLLEKIKAVRPVLTEQYDQLDAS